MSIHLSPELRPLRPVVKRLYLVIPASPTATFFSQIAMFELAVRYRTWRSFTPQVIAVFGGRPTSSTYDAWQTHLGNVAKIFIPGEQSCEGDYMRQIDWRFHAVPADADIAVFCDADTLIVGDIEQVATTILAERSVGGVLAHYHFPGGSEPNSRQAWNHISEALIGRPMTFGFRYSLVPQESPPEQRMAPFYLNFGAVFVPGAILGTLGRRYLDLRPRVSAMTGGSYMAAQIALALAMEAVQTPRRALSMAYNFPNDPIADEYYPDELADARILHYLRRDLLDRDRIFVNAREFEYFLGLQLQGSNSLLQSFVRELTSGIYPFKGIG